MIVSRARWRVLLGVTVYSMVTACTDSRPQRAVATPTTDVPGGESLSAVDEARRGLPTDRALRLLPGGAGSDNPGTYRGVRDTAGLHGGTIIGRVEGPMPVVGDFAVTPTHDVRVCKPFTETRMPSQDGGAGDAIVWLVGVTTGPMPNAPRRASLTLDRCRLEPRVQRVAVGGTLQVISRDAMSSRLRFLDAGGRGTVRTLVALSDAGQVVPTSDVSLTPGLVEVRDDQHPWIRAWIAVTSHPFVAITEPGGNFRFDSVPPGSYTLVIWQEQLGTRSRALQVVSGVETRIRIAYHVQTEK